MRAVPMIAALVVGVACRAEAGDTAGRGDVVTRPVTVDELVRLRCAADGRQVMTTWTGAVYAYPEGAPPIALFDVVGMNVARCLELDGTWYLTSRELMFYLAPGGDRPLMRWRNPWTEAEVPVMHVANRLVQMPLGGGAAVTFSDGRATVVIDVPLFYPNPLADDPDGGGPSYQGGEFFVLGGPAEGLAAGATVPTLDLVWHRVGPWLPWMGQADRPGYLVYRATGRKVASVDALPAFMRDELAARAMLFATAPTCVVDGPNHTSWTYFAEHRAAYQRGERFPIAAPATPERCRTSARVR